MIALCLGAVLSLAAMRALADDASLPRCWVEFRFSPPSTELRRSGLKLPRFLKHLKRYAVVTNPEAPDYRGGVAEKKYFVLLFFANCAESQRSVDVLIQDYEGRTEPPLITKLTMRSPRPSDIRRTEFLFERPKYWRVECLVAIDTVREQPRHFPSERGLVPYMIRYNRPLLDTSSFMSIEYDRDTPRRYLLFWRFCDRRLEMARKFIDAYHRFAPDGARYKVVDTAFDTLPNGISTSGSVWLDHYFPEGRPKN